MGRIYYNSNGVILENSKILFDGIPQPTPLTYPGSTHTEEEVIALGGSIFTITDEGEFFGKTIGVFYQDSNHATLDIPSGWSLAEGVNGKYYHVRDLTYTDYCGYNFATYNDTLGIVNWPNSQFGYAGGTIYGEYVNCAHANENVPGKWIIYYSNSPYFVRALNVVSWVLGTNSTKGHAGHEIIAFGAF